MRLIYNLWVLAGTHLTLVVTFPFHYQTGNEVIQWILTLSDFSRACFLNCSKLVFAEGMDALRVTRGLGVSSSGLVGVGGGLFFTSGRIAGEGVGVWEVREERTEAAEGGCGRGFVGGAIELAEVVSKEEEVERVGVGRVRGGEETFRPEMVWTEAILVNVSVLPVTILAFNLRRCQI